MAQSALPVDIPLSPPPYEEAILTTAPEIPVVETDSNDEPPPSYSEATKNDDFPTRYPGQPSTNDLTELIIAGIVSADRPRQGRQPLLSHQLEPSEQCPPDNEETREVQSRTFQNRFRRQKKLSVCLLGAGMGVFLVAGLIAASVLRHKPNISSHSTSNQAYMKSVTVAPVDPAIRKMVWLNTLRPKDLSRIEDFQKSRQQKMSLFDALQKAIQQANMDQPFIFHIKKHNRDNSARTQDQFQNNISEVDSRPVVSTDDPFYEELRKIVNIESANIESANIESANTTPETKKVDHVDKVPKVR